MKLTGKCSEWSLRSALVISSLMVSAALPQVVDAAGNGGNGPGKGIYYGDLYVIARHASGLPLFVTCASEEGVSILSDDTVAPECVMQPVAFPGFTDRTVGGGEFTVPITNAATDCPLTVGGLFGADAAPALADYCVVPIDTEGEVLSSSGLVPLEVEFGRLNLGRSPQDVISARLAEATGTLTATPDIPLAFDAAGRLVATLSDDDGNLVEKTVDAALENLALYWAGMQAGELTGLDDAGDDRTPIYSVVTADAFNVGAAYDFMNLAGVFFGAAADKSGHLTVDHIAYMNSFLLGMLEPLTAVDGEYSLPATAPNTITLDGYPAGGSSTFVDYSGYGYDRDDVYPGCVLYYDNYAWTSERIKSAVFNDDGDFTPVQDVAAFAKRSDDARAVINFLHAYLIEAVDSVGSEDTCAMYPPGRYTCTIDGCVMIE